MNIKPKKMKNKNKEIGKALRLVWSSLDSHIDWTHGKSAEGQAHHIQAMREYAETIVILCDQLNVPKKKPKE